MNINNVPAWLSSYLRNPLLPLAVILCLFCSSSFAAEPPPAADDEKQLFALGVLLGSGLEVFQLSSADAQKVVAGLTDSLAGRTKTSSEDLQKSVLELQKKRLPKFIEGQKKAGQEYAAKVATEKGAEKLASGVVYQELKAGTGASPTATDKVKVHYHGTLLDGSVFDSSVARGQPVEFPLNGVIKCWTEGVQKMKVGGKSKLVCPSDVAYGDSGRPQKIKPGATLVFEVELLEIAKDVPAPAPTQTPSAGR